MKRRRRCGERFSDESVDPMNYVSNLSDAMLVLAVGMMLALIVHWNVDISTGGRSSENVRRDRRGRGAGRPSAIDRDNALSFTPEELEQMDSTEDETDEGHGKARRGLLRRRDGKILHYRKRKLRPMKLQNHAYPRRFAVLGAVFRRHCSAPCCSGAFPSRRRSCSACCLSRLTETEPGWRDGAEERCVPDPPSARCGCGPHRGRAGGRGRSYQGMFRNPMVSPDILGASTGAGFGAALAILLGAGYFGISASAFMFGLLAVAAAYAVSCMSRTNQTIALILVSMMVSSLFSAGTSYIKLVADTQQQLPAITYWLMGSLSSIKPRDVLFLVIPVTLGLVPLWDPELAHEPADARRGGGALYGREYPPAAIHRHSLRNAADGGVRCGLRHDRLGRPCHPAFLPDAVRL